MSILIFTGPTISADDAARLLDAVYCPPATQGSIFQAASHHPRVIGIIDGRFESVPSIWHKEILWAMSQGIHVFGAASMGALRAAELSAFGMTGVGSIFEAYANGELEDDDEVAVAHTGSDHGFAAASVAMVNIRATLAAAETSGIISPQTREALQEFAKQHFYADRSYESLLRHCAEVTIENEYRAFREWLPSGQVDQKRIDAEAMLKAIDEFLRTDPSPLQPRFAFQNTAYWEKLLGTANHNQPHFTQQETPGSAVIEELQISGSPYHDVSRTALGRFLAVKESLNEGFDPDHDDVSLATSRFRETHGLLTDSAFQHWLKSNHLDSSQFRRLMHDEARLHWVHGIARNGVWSLLLDQSRVQEQYVPLFARAEKKLSVLREHGLLNPSPADTGLKQEQLLAWYFQYCLSASLPQDVTRFALDMGFDDLSQFTRAVAREYCFRRFNVPASMATEIAPDSAANHASVFGIKT
jgi:hypothetical protein